MAITEQAAETEVGEIGTAVSRLSTTAADIARGLQTLRDELESVLTVHVDPPSEGVDTSPAPPESPLAQRIGCVEDTMTEIFTSINRIREQLRL